MDPAARRPPSPASVGPIVGSVAAVGATAAMFALAAGIEQPTVAEVVAEAIASLTPLHVIEGMIGLFGTAAKKILLGGVLLGQVAAGAGLGLLFQQRRFTSLQSTVALILAIGIVGLVLLPVLGAGVLGAHTRAGAPATLASLALSGVTFALVFSGLWAILHPSGTFAEEDAAARRALLRNALVALGGSIAGAAAVRWVIDSLTPPEVPAILSGEVARTNAILSSAPSLARAIELGIPGLSPEITPNDKFYVVSKNVFRDPSVQEAAWRLEIKGLVDRPLTLTYQEIKTLPASNQFFTLQCISNEVGGELIGNADWRGVHLADLLHRARVQTSAVDVILRAADDYADSIPIEKALQTGTLLVYEMNGQVLPKEHGFPVRLLVPDIYGMKNVKWVTSFEVVDYDFKGYWQTRGWSDIATINTTARIDIPKNGSFLSSGANFIGGIAHAGQRGIERVEVSLDGGRTWEPAVAKAALGPNAWALWLYRWNAPAIEPGQKLMARAMDGTGAIQPATVRETLPDGASGYHAIVVRRAES